MVRSSSIVVSTKLCGVVMAVVLDQGLAVGEAACSATPVQSHPVPSATHLTSVTAEAPTRAAASGRFGQRNGCNSVRNGQ